MRNTVAKRLRRIAEQETVGKPAIATRKLYKQLKAGHKAIKQPGR